jgi:hypothetical protein
MLRQQAKELDEAGHMIGVLREYISDLENGLDSSIKLNKAQAERNNKPVAWIDEINTFVLDKDYQQFPKSLQHGMIPLYTHPAELTDEEIYQLWDSCRTGIVYAQIQAFARAILRKAQE